MSIANFTYESDMYSDIFEAMSSLNFLGVSVSQKQVDVWNIKIHDNSLGKKAG